MDTLRLLMECDGVGPPDTNLTRKEHARYRLLRSVAKGSLYGQQLRDPAWLLSLVRKQPPPDSYDNSKRATKKYRKQQVYILRHTDNQSQHNSSPNYDTVRWTTRGYDPNQGSKGRGLGVPVPQATHHKP